MSARNLPYIVANVAATLFLGAWYAIIGLVMVGFVAALLIAVAR